MLLHAKHAFPPNNLGYCGPDVRGKIEDYLHGSSDEESLLRYLTKFEAAYPFVKMIAESTGTSPFDYQVTEAYWLGNSLLDRIKPREFYQFTQNELISSRGLVGKKDGMKKREAKLLFKQLGPMARPHHTFYVLDMFAKTGEKSGVRGKILELMDSCRISWGRILEVKKDTLVVERPSLTIDESGQLALTAVPVKKEVVYDPAIQPFNLIKKGDWISIHWNFASERLTAPQVRNLKKFTALDIRATNYSSLITPAFP